VNGTQPVRDGTVHVSNTVSHPLLKAPQSTPLELCGAFGVVMLILDRVKVHGDALAPAYTQQ
jgi:hypothetical protein